MGESFARVHLCGLVVTALISVALQRPEPVLGCMISAALWVPVAYMLDSWSAVAHCIDCGRPGPGTRCPDHERARKRIRNADTARAKAIVAAAPWCHCTRPSCHGHDGECGRIADLTADHVIPLAAGGTNDGPRQVLCRSCNTRKGTR